MTKRRIAIARITGLADRKGRWPVTFGGDGLIDLKPPFVAELYRPAYRGTDLKKILKTATQGPQDDGPYYPIEVLSVALRNKKASVRIEFSSAKSLPDLLDPEEMNGMWICVQASELGKSASENEYFVYELLDLPVFRRAGDPQAGIVVGYLDTGAHGVLEIKPEGWEDTIFVPMIGRFVSFMQGRTGLLIPDLDDFFV